MCEAFANCDGATKGQAARKKCEQQQHQRSQGISGERKLAVTVAVPGTIRGGSVLGAGPGAGAGTRTWARRRVRAGLTLREVGVLITDPLRLRGIWSCGGSPGERREQSGNGHDHDETQMVNGRLLHTH